MEHSTGESKALHVHFENIYFNARKQKITADFAWFELYALALFTVFLLGLHSVHPLLFLSAV